MLIWENSSSTQRNNRSLISNQKYNKAKISSPKTSKDKIFLQFILENNDDFYEPRKNGINTKKSHENDVPNFNPKNCLNVSVKICFQISPTPYSPGQNRVEQRVGCTRCPLPRNNIGRCNGARLLSAWLLSQ